MKVRIRVQPTGIYNGDYWPTAGQIINLPDHVAAGMIRAGNVVQVEDVPKDPVEETRPSVKPVEKRSE